MEPPPSLLFAAQVSQSEPLELVSVDTSFALTSVCLGENASAGRNTLLVSVGGRPHIAIANLQRDHNENAPIHVIFEKDAQVSFAVKGDSTMCLTGAYMVDEEEMEDMDWQQQQFASDDDDGEVMWAQIMGPEGDEVEQPPDDSLGDQPVVAEVVKKQERPAGGASTQPLDSNKGGGDASSETKSMFVNGEQLFYIDLSEGGGKHRIKPGSRVRIRYVGRLAANDRVFDQSGKSCFNFQVGHGVVIKGLDHGVRGMRMGARRKIFIPPDLAYGAVGVPPDIPPDSSLVFDVEFVAFGAGTGKKKRRNEKRQGSPPAFESAHSGPSKRNRKRKKKRKQQSGSE